VFKKSGGIGTYHEQLPNQDTPDLEDKESSTPQNIQAACQQGKRWHWMN